MRYCGIDVSAKAGTQQLCTLHERRGPDGLELVATFYEPGTVEQVARTVHGLGRGQALGCLRGPFEPCGRIGGQLGAVDRAQAVLYATERGWL